MLVQPQRRWSRSYASLVHTQAPRHIGFNVKHRNSVILQLHETTPGAFASICVSPIRFSHRNDQRSHTPKKTDMNIQTGRKSMLTLYSALAFTACTLSAQEAAKTGANSAPPDMSPSDDSVMVLDPFSVSTESEGYKAVDTLGGARVRTKLADTPSSLSVITTKELQDLAVTNAQDLLVYTNNTEVGGSGGNFSGVTSRGAGISISGAAEGARLTNPAGTNRMRGLTAMDNTRNYFL